MGNKHSCCAWRSGRRSRGGERKSSWRDGEDCSGQHENGGAGESMGDREESGANLQHISEREPDDLDRDPSVHPSATTLFIEKSKRAIQSKS